jgi:hypothetical protein
MDSSDKKDETATSLCEKYIKGATEMERTIGLNVFWQRNGVTPSVMPTVFQLDPQVFV